MSRPKIDRMVACPPRFNSFKPVGVRRTDLERVVLSLDEYEAIKLSNHIKLGQQEASEEMGISRPTFTRLLNGALQKIADFLINGKELIVEGGNIHFRENFIECLDCGHRFKIDIETEVNKCPSCGSTHLLDFAGKFGHGRCCHRRGRK